MTPLPGILPSTLKSIQETYFSFSTFLRKHIIHFHHKNLTSLRYTKGYAKAIQAVYMEIVHDSNDRSDFCVENIILHEARSMKNVFPGRS